MHEHLNDLYAYNYWANQLYIKKLNDFQFQNPKFYSIFSHLLNAHSIWLSRINGEIEKYNVWQIHQALNFSKINDENFQITQILLKNLNETDLNKSIDYVNSQGNRYQNKTKDILIHAVNHATYHRAQCASIMKEHGVQPPITDFIAYKRL